MPLQQARDLVAYGRQRPVLDFDELAPSHRIDAEAVEPDLEPCPRSAVDRLEFAVERGFHGWWADGRRQTA
jgi:hypothetical protein